MNVITMVWSRSINNMSTLIRNGEWGHLVNKFNKKLMSVSSYIDVVKYR